MGLHLHRKLTAYVIAAMMLVSIQAPAIFAEDDPGPTDATTQQATSPTTEQTQSTQPTQPENDPPESVDGSSDKAEPAERETREAGDDRDETEDDVTQDEEGRSIKVLLTIRVDEQTCWIEDMPGEIASGSTVGELLERVTEDQEYGFDYSENGDLVCVTRPESEGGDSIDTEDAETDGTWIYKIDGVERKDPLRDYILEDGDRLTILFDKNAEKEAEVLQTEKARSNVVGKSAKAAMTATQVPDPTIYNAYGNTKDKLTELAEGANWTEDSVWIVMGLARGGELTDAQGKAYYSDIEKRLEDRNSAKLNDDQSSNNSRAILALTAAGCDPTDVGGYDLLEPLANMAYVQKQGINGPIWALLAFDSNDYDIPNTSSGVQTTRDGLIRTILSAQKNDNGWAFSGNTSDVDMTCMVIQALAPYYRNDHKVTVGGQEKSVKEAVDKALTWLSSRQNSDGSFSSGGVVTSESASQVIVALTSLGIDPTKDKRFLKNGKGAVDSLMSFYVKGGGFKHIESNYKANTLASMQANYALVAYYRNRDKVNTLYDMTDAGNGYKINGDYDREDDPSDDDPDHKDDKDKKDKKSKDRRGNNIKPALPSATGKTMGLTRSAGLIKLTGAKTKEALASIGLIEAVVKRGLPKEARDYSEDDIKAIEDAFKAYMKLSPAEKLAVEKDKYWKSYNEIISKLGRWYHFDEPTGVDMRANDEATLPWYIRLVVEEEELTTTQKKSIDDALQGRGSVADTYDIYFINTLDDKRWKPDRIVGVDMPISVITDKEPLIVHITDKGKIEFIRGTVVEAEDGSDSYSEKLVRFKATDFSIYGLVINVGSIGKLMEKQEQEEKLPLLWICISAGALLVLAALIIARRRLNDHEQ